jgi:hypothetical protein
VPISPEIPSELTRRLALQFPAGSTENALIAELQKQGFTLQGACEKDPSIRIAKFHLDGSLQNPIAIDAFAYWKSDDGGHVVWTHGQIWLTGP